MNESFFYTVGIPGIKIERHTFYAHFFLSNMAMNLLNNTVICRVPENFYRGFGGIILFFPSGRGRTEVSLFGCFYDFHLIIHIQNYRDADITF